MEGVLALFLAELFKFQRFGRVGLVLFSCVVDAAAFRAFQANEWARSLFCHFLILTLTLEPRRGIEPRTSFLP